MRLTINIFHKTSFTFLIITFSFPLFHILRRFACINFIGFRTTFDSRELQSESEKPSDEGIVTTDETPLSLPINIPRDERSKLYLKACPVS